MHYRKTFFLLSFSMLLIGCPNNKTKGEKGEKGDKGEIGTRGEKGDPGARGEKGEKGEKGDRGSQGENGAPGRDGADGERGETGPQGEKGEAAHVIAPDFTLSVPMHPCSRVYFLAPSYDVYTIQAKLVNNSEETHTCILNGILNANSLGSAACSPYDVVLNDKSTSGVILTALCAPILHNSGGLSPDMSFKAIVTCCDQNTGTCTHRSLSSICN